MHLAPIPQAKAQDRWGCDGAGGLRDFDVSREAWAFAAAIVLAFAPVGLSRAEAVKGPGPASGSGSAASHGEAPVPRAIPVPDDDKNGPPLPAAPSGSSAVAEALSSEWDPAPETLVLYNPKSEGSETLARFYAQKRHIPSQHLIALPCSTDETISRQEFESNIRQPLAQRLGDEHWWEVENRDLLDPNGRPYTKAKVVVRMDMHVLALMRGMPLRIARSPNSGDTKQLHEDEASVDSELAALGPLLSRPIAGPLQNEYFQSARRFPDCYAARGEFLVGRLDAGDDATVRRMIEDSIKAEREGLWGRAVLDFALKDGGYTEGEQWLAHCAALYREEGIPMYVDRYREVIPEAWPMPDTILYFGWYASSITGGPASPDFRFKPGAIACHLHSFSGQTLRTPGQGWVRPLLDHGAAATLGNVWEPYLTLTVHFDILNQRLLEGYTLAEAAWSATPAVSWMNIVVGDPLYRPFPKNRRPPAATAPTQEQEDALYRDLVRRVLKHDERKFCHDLLQVAEERHSAHLVELAGLLFAAAGTYGEASDYFQHARAWYARPEDQLRCALYDADLSRRKGDPAESYSLVHEIVKDPIFAQLPAILAAQDMEKELRPEQPPTNAPSRVATPVGP